MRQSTPASRRPSGSRKRVAIMLDLEWPYRRHFDVLVGTQNYAQAHGHWDCVLDEFAAVTLAETRNNPAYDGVIARATPELARNAARAKVPVVNVWYNSLATP